MKLFRFKGKKVLAGILTVAMVITVAPATAKAQEAEEKYPHTLFASSKENGAITMNAENLCVNGAVATNGTIAVNGTVNVNGERTEQASIAMVELGEGLDKNYFATQGKVVYASDYFFEDGNVSVTAPMEVAGNLTLFGNMNLNAGLRAKEDIILSGNSLNANQAVVYAENGDITLDFYNINFTGLIYAPEGAVSITAPYTNLNSVIVIAETITIDAMYANVNYNANMAQFITENAGVADGEDAGEEKEEEKDEEDIETDDNVPEALEFYAYGSYNSETNCVDIEWYTESDAAEFEVLSSDDNETYQAVAAVTGSTFYAYPVTEDFEIKYFKVSMKDIEGECKETLPFMIVKGESGYETELFDTDGDKIPDILEAMFGTDAEKADTDADDLTDYEELYLTGTVPVVFDSITEGVGDAKADCDGDGLINKEELVLGTNPLLGDTDEDLFSDFDEVNEYGTDPLVEDTDEDGIKDGEEPLLGLDPKNPATFGVPDAAYQVEQSVSSESEVFKEVNTEENPYQMSLDIVAAGYVEGSLDVEESKYASVMQNDAILGFVPELNYTLEDSIDKVTLRFEIDEEYMENTLGLFPEEEELTGIKRLNVFKYFEDLNMLLPIETKFDEENNVLYTEVDELGTYCVMDMELWLESLGIMETEEAEPMVYSMRPTAVQEETAFEGDMRLSVPVKETEVEEKEDVETVLVEEPMVMSARGVIKHETPVDIAFLIQIEGTSETDYLLQEQMIIDVTKQIYNEYSDVRVCIIGYGENEASIVSSYTNPIWQLNVGQVQGALGKIEYVETYEYCNRGAAFSLMSELDFRENAAKFVFHLANGNSGVQAGFFSELEVCAENNINYTEILPLGSYYLDPNFAAALQAAIDKTNGLSLTYTEETPEIVYEHIVSHVAPARYEFEAIVPNGWKKIVLNDILEKNSDTDTDGDGLEDFVEVNWNLISWETDGTVVLPTIKRCMELIKKPYAEEGLTRFLATKAGNGMPDTIYSEKVNAVINSNCILPIYSDPTSKDSDEDGYSDYEEREVYISNPLFSNVKSVTIQPFIDPEEEIQNEYISVNTSDESGLPNFGYGGNQNWFYDEEDVTKNGKLNLRIKNNGCGVIASCDLILYLQETVGLNLTDIELENGVIKYEEYEKFIYSYLKNYLEPFDVETPLVGSVKREDIEIERPNHMSEFEEIWYDALEDYIYNQTIAINTKMSDILTEGTGSIGCIPMSVADMLNQYCYDNGYSSMNMTYYLSNTLSKSEVENRLCKSFKQNIPAILLVGVETKVPFRYEDETIMSKNMEEHYVVITGIEIDNIIGKTKLTVSTWSHKAVLYLEDFIDNPGMFGGYYINS